MSNTIYDVNSNQIYTAFTYDNTEVTEVYDVEGNAVSLAELPEPTENAWYISQIGYDTDKAKIATLVNVSDNTDFSVIDILNGTSVYDGIIIDNKADFSSVSDGRYYLKSGDKVSYDFVISSNRIWNVEAPVALRFMEMSRQDAWETGGNTGYAWRDGHQFSFELCGLVMQYMSNPSYYKTQRNSVYHVSETEYEELREQDCPNIIWLMKFAIKRYYDWNVNQGIKLHALIKGQIAYFLYIYPHISEYVSTELYETIRDWAISIWPEQTCNKAWYDIDINHNLFATQSVIGGIKGACPPGYAIVPNLMMYEVCIRDSVATANNFMDAAENNIAWLVNSVDLTDSANTKGQRMNEYIPIHALTYAYEMYPNHCPNGTYAKIEAAAEKLVSLSENMWDYTKYSVARWVNLEESGGLCNNPGYIGMMGVYYALSRVITDNALKSRLKELAISHHDHAFGRNPFGRCYDYKATTDFDGAKLGWSERYARGLGALDDCIGVLDGSPKEESYPYNPNANAGYSEGWVAFNSAWNMALAYLAGEKNRGVGVFAPKA